MTSDAPTAALVETPEREGRAPVKDPLTTGTRRWFFLRNDLHRPGSLTTNLRYGSRRVFLKTGLASLGAAALWMMNHIARQAESIPENLESTTTVPWNAAQGVHFYEGMIVVNGPGEVAVFSSGCPHLGCRVNRTEGTELVCPCHGSRFDLSGRATRGPAGRRLRALPFTLDRTGGVLRVTLEDRSL